MLLDVVVQSSQLFPVTFLQWRSIDDHLDVSTMDEAWSVISRLQTLDCFVVVFSRMRKTFDCTSCRSILECMLEINDFLSIRKTYSVMHRHGELIPKLLPVNDVSIKGRYIQLREFDSRTVRRSVRRRSLAGSRYQQTLDFGGSFR